MQLDFVSQIATMARNLSDKELYKLVIGHVSSNGMSEETPAEPKKAAPPPTPAPAPAPAKKKTAKKKAPKATVGGGSGSGAQAAASADPMLTENIMRWVKESNGVSVSEVAEHFGEDKMKVSYALKRLFVGQKISRAGDRRYTRYAADEDTALQASLRARGKVEE